MKFVAAILERLRPHFEDGGRFERLKPVYEAADAFFLSPPDRTATAPHVRDPLDIKRFMSMVIIALAPCVVASVYFFGLRVLCLIAVSYAAGGLVEVMFAVIRREKINEGFLVTGLIFPLTLPPGLPFWMAAAGVVFGVLVGKELFGGTGRNLFNPALVGRCFLALGYPRAMADAWVPSGGGGIGRLLQYVDASGVDALTQATPLAEARHGSLAPVMELLWGNVAGSAGETSAIAIIAGGIFLLLVKVANWRIVAGMLGSFAVLNAILRALEPAAFNPVGWNLPAGGLLFGAFFMATDPVTSPATAAGKWIYGVIAGCTALLIRSLSTYTEGVMFAILLGNIAAPVLDEIAIRVKFRRKSNSELTTEAQRT